MVEVWVPGCRQILVAIHKKVVFACYPTRSLKELPFLKIRSRDALEICMRIAQVEGTNSYANRGLWEVVRCLLPYTGKSIYRAL